MLAARTTTTTLAPSGVQQPLRASRLRLPARSAPRRQQRAAPVAAAGAAGAAAALLAPAAVFDAATVLVLPIYAAMIAAPRAQLTRRLLGTPAILTLAAALYAALLAMWQPLPAIAAVVNGALAAARGAVGAGGGLGAALQQALPSMPAFAGLFGSPEITALAWVHLVLLDLVQAR